MQAINGQNTLQQLNKRTIFERYSNKFMGKKGKISFQIIGYQNGTKMAKS